MIRLHASCVVVEGMGLLLRGPSGSGKSDLALRLIEAGAELVADDQVELERKADRLLASPPANIAGLLEVRGVGIFRFPFRAAIPVGLLIDLVPATEIERLPEPEIEMLEGCRIDKLSLFPWEASAAAKVRLAVDAARGVIMRLP